ncbi:hypothetical protein KILIM_076_00210 [Kineosphaera limosa NBRC 100340]|uniref:3-methyladenine DNA glycosylase n=1 Tax=Kineosphaera limosa NBRC 100340 TaxID=1184609 RepID=K6WUV9_9MICO|nr:hypothetical protein KILIM_076_00210 [Kineosphaera limosa NBRC 100340]
MPDPGHPGTATTLADAAYPGPVKLAPGEWLARQSAHVRRVDEAAAGYLSRRSRGAKHPVDDFLWIYFRFRPGQLRRWHPGAGVTLTQAADSEHAGRRHYQVAGGDVRLDVPGFLAERGSGVRYVRDLLAATASRPPRFGCFGLHEWAMVYRSPEVRHPWPLRLGAAGTDAVVESRPLRCTHYDAFRFFTPQASGRNELTPTLELRPTLEQPGCLHAGMDLYKWAYTLTPAIASELVMDCFEHARRAREVDMRASPYDLRDLGYEPIPIETAAGRAEYVAAQQDLAGEAAALRSRLLRACDDLLAGHPQPALAAAPN